MDSGYSVEDDVQAALHHALEQLKVVQDLQTGLGRGTGTVQEMAEMFGDLIAALSKQVLRLAREVDNLRAAIEEG